MAKNIIFSLIFSVISVGIAFLIYIIVRKYLKDILDHIIKIPSATVFYSRIFFFSLIFPALGKALNTSFKMEENTATMEYVWKLIRELDDVLIVIGVFAFIFLMYITVLIAALRYKK